MPARNEELHLGRCLGGLILATNRWGGKQEIVLVDNGSDDSTKEIATAKGCRVIEVPNATISRLRNIGSQNSSGDVIAFLDADCLVAPEWIMYCMEAFDNKEIGIVGTRAVPDLKSPTWVEKSWYNLMSGAKRPAFPDWIGTSNLFIKKEDFFRLGGFDEQLETAEDINLCYDLRRQGKLIYLEQRVNTTHLRESKTLKEMLRREYWRGKSTLRSFVRNSFHLEELPSVLLPSINIMLMLGMIILAVLGSIYVVLPLGLLALVPAVILIKKRVGNESVNRLWQCYVVSLVYVFARSCSLIYELTYFAAKTWTRQNSNIAVTKETDSKGST
jgi:glycosyltransferase involved in cell wall biosynthesis